MMVMKKRVNLLNYFQEKKKSLLNEFAGLFAKIHYNSHEDCTPVQWRLVTNVSIINVSRSMMRKLYQYPQYQWWFCRTNKFFRKKYNINNNAIYLTTAGWQNQRRPKPIKAHSPLAFYTNAHHIDIQVSIRKMNAVVIDLTRLNTLAPKTRSTRPSSPTFV